MSKRWFAACGLGIASASVSAQSNVTLYGVADIYTEFLTNQATPGNGAGHLIRMASGGKSGSRWGLRGSETLGDGWQAEFRLESTVNLNNGTSVGAGGFDRQAWVGIHHEKWGGIRLGRQYTSIFDVLEHFGPTDGYSTIYEPDGAIVGLNFRENNVAKYYADIGGLSVRAHYSFGGTAGAFSSGAAWGAGFDYTFGIVSVAAAFDDVNGTIPNVTHFHRYATAVMATPGRATLMAGFEHANGNVTTPGVVRRFDFYWVGARYQVTPALQAVGGFYYENIAAQNPAQGQTGAQPTNPKQVGFQLNYVLSKTTMVYLTGGYVWHAALDFDNDNYHILNYSLAAGRSNSAGMALGVRKLF